MGLSLCIQQLGISPLVFCFGFVEQEFGQHPLVRQGQYFAPFGYVAASQGIYGVYVFEFSKRLDARFSLQYRRSCCKKPVLCFNKLG